MIYIFLGVGETSGVTCESHDGLTSVLMRCRVFSSGRVGNHILVT